MSTTSRVPLQLPLLPASDLCQRWREQRVVWRHRHAAGETFIPRGYEVAPIGRPQTADFLRDHHYLHKLPATRFRLGLLHGVDLVGIAVLGPGVPHTLRARFPDLETLLLGVGAPPRWSIEKPDAWLDRVLPLVSSPYVHVGNHRYSFLIGRHPRGLRIGTSAQPYPKHRCAEQ